MGLYRQEYRAPDGATKTVAIWTARYRDARGILRRESTGLTDYAEAKRWLKLREGRAAEGKIILPRADKITVAELSADLVNDYRINERRSLPRLEDSLGHLLPYFGRQRATQVSSADIRAYVVKRQGEDARNATIN